LDLKYAKTNLNQQYVSTNSLTASDERVRPNQAAAASLMSRVYLYDSKFLDAETEASFVIDQSAKYSLVALDDVFLKNSLEAIWQLTPTTPNAGNTAEATYFIITSPPGGTGNATISEQLISAFENSDQRKIHWIGKYTDDLSNPMFEYYFPYKYKTNTTLELKEYSMVIRLAELYLIRSEARVKIGNLSGAINDLDKIRERAGLPSVKSSNPNISSVEILNHILKERQIEFFAEQGHRWMDLKRTGNINAVMSSVTQSKGGNWESYKQLWPIPQSEILNDPNLKQNEGYY